MFRTGPRNLITDVAGLRVGNASDASLKSGVTTVLCDTPTVAGVQILGGAPGTVGVSQSTVVTPDFR
ncbi:P1 family peptidase, partial [Mesorhizobium sp. M7A.F.Ca.CA.004.09.1.2]|uniref:P1 family peptidase n=1 Tax=Mesorhizobium sp. M7A.F.Ca.CA.004.09.1.2 TaxID=2496695 RepID=UPI000FD217FA